MAGLTGREGTAGESKAAEAVFLGKLRVSYTDASAELQEFAVESAKTALQKHVKGSSKYYSDVAAELQSLLADKFKGTWHCIVGKSFGSMITQETGQYVRDSCGACLLLRPGLIALALCPSPVQSTVFLHWASWLPGLQARLDVCARPPRCFCENATLFTKPFLALCAARCTVMVH